MDTLIFVVLTVIEVTLCGLLPFFLVFLVFFAIIRAIFSVKVWPGEVVALYWEGSRRVVDFYDKPGRHWRDRRSFPEHDQRPLRRLRLRIDEPVIITSRPVEARTQDDASAVVTVRLTLDVTNSARYATAVVGKEWAEWQEEILPALIAHVVSGNTFTQTLNNREQVTHSIEGAVAAWFAGNSASDFGLSFKRAAIIEAASLPVLRG